MADQVRTSVILAGIRLPENSISSLSLHQSLNAHHTFDLRLDKSLAKEALGDATKKWIGQPVTLGFDYSPDDLLQSMPVTKRFKGVVTRIGLSRGGGSAEMIVSGHGPTYLLDDGPRTRSFTDMTPEEIVAKVTNDYGGAFDAIEITPEQKTDALAYTVQYRENNYDFLNRLANRYGEWFYYDGFELHYGAKPASNPLVKLDFFDKALQNFDLQVQTQPAQRELLAYDYQTDKVSTATLPAKISSSKLGKLAIDKAKSDLFPNAPLVNLGENIPEADLKDMAARQEQILHDEAVVASGSSREPALNIGTRISVSDSEVREEYGEFIVTSVSHYVVQGGEYQNNFEAYPVEVETPPLEALTAPPFCETQTAVVTSTEDDESLGRVRVRFHWQEDGEESPLIRVATPYAGGNKGFFITHEVGDHVLVGFENNSPDHPYVLLGMYHGQAKPTHYDSQNRYKGFSSKADIEIVFDDVDENITLSASKTIIIKATEKITLDAGEGKAKIVLDGKAGKISLDSGKELKIDSTKVEAKASGEFKASGPSAEISGTDVKVAGSTSAEMSGGGGKVKAAGGQVTLN